MDFNTILKPGMRAEKTETVTEKNVAAAYGSGALAVYSTPAMIALMEMTSFSITAPLLPQGWTTVGTDLNVKHLAATPPGMKIRCQAELLEVDGRRLSFKVEAFDETEKVGEGTHGRFIVEGERFLKKINEKAQKQ